MKGRRIVLASVLLGALAGCGKGGPSNVAPLAVSASRAEVDSLWRRANAFYVKGTWHKAAPLYERIGLEVPAGDPIAVEAQFRLGECYFGQGMQLQAARQFRKVSDDTPTSPLAATALLRAGDAYGDLWRRPELDPTYGQTALATYQELLNRYPDSPVAARARLRIATLEEWFAVKEFKAAQFYMRLKAYDSAILYLKDLAATYPRASVTPGALLVLVRAYKAVNYPEDLAETCGYIRRYHPSTAGLDVACPASVPSAEPPPTPAASPGS
jgi:outer membrane protein assembly factor BamD